MELRDYQQWFRHDILEAMKAGHDSVLAVMPTGGGKRYSIVDLCLLAMQHDRPVLVVTDRRLLVDQMVKECEQHGVRFGVIMADYPRGNPLGIIQIASVQTLQSRFLKAGLGARFGEGMPECSLILIDEAHQSGNRYRQVREFYPDAKCIGFTATPAGPDGKSLTPHSFSKMVVGATNSDLISRGFLLPTRVFAPSEPSLKNVSSPGSREYNQIQLSKAVKECTVAGDIFREYEKFMDRAAVCFAPGIPFARSLVAQFNDRYGPNCARLVEAATKHQEREDIFAAVREGDVKVLASVGVLKEGFDLPALSLGLDLEPNSQLRTYWQKVGRVKRAFPGQTDAVWIDLAGNYWNHIHPDDDPEWPDGTEETTTDIVERKKSEPGEVTSICCPACSHIRRGGAVCPNCGHEGVKSLRRVRVGIGELREVRPKDNKKKELTHEQKMFRQWQSRLFAAMHSGATYSQCAAIFRREHGEMPSPKWPGVFPAHSVEWNRRPKSQHTRGSLYAACRNYLESISNGT